MTRTGTPNQPPTHGCAPLTNARMRMHPRGGKDSSITSVSLFLPACSSTSHKSQLIDCLIKVPHGLQTTTMNAAHSHQQPHGQQLVCLTCPLSLVLVLPMRTHGRRATTITPTSNQPASETNASKVPHEQKEVAPQFAPGTRNQTFVEWQGDT